MTNQQFVSQEMIAQLIWEAQGGSEEARVQLEELDVWESSPSLPKSYHSNERPCQCGSGQPWVSCSANSSYCG